VIQIIVPDNLPQEVKHACRYEPDLIPTYLEIAQDYRVAVIPARMRRPRDKAKVEVGVQVVERWI
jgi:transposase